MTRSETMLLNLYRLALERHWVVGYINHAKELPDGGWTVKEGSTFIGWHETFDGALRAAEERLMAIESGKK